MERLSRRALFRLAGSVAIVAACGPELSKSTPQPTLRQIVELPAFLTTPEPSASPILKPTQQPTPEPTPDPTQQPETPKPKTPEPQPQQENSQALKVIYRGNENRREICLTFDAGAGSKNTPAILDILKEKNVKATMFLTGLWMQQNPSLTKRIAEEYEHFNHSNDHTDFRNLLPDAIKTQLRITEKISLQLTGKSTKPVFRPPYGGYNSTVLVTVANEGYTKFVYWTFDTIDWDYSRTPEDVYNSMMSGKNTAPPRPPEGYAGPPNGSIVLMHLDSALEPKILGKIIDDVRVKGINFVNLTRVLS